MTLEFALEAAAVLVGAAPGLVLLDWWFRFSPSAFQPADLAVVRHPPVPGLGPSVAGRRRNSTISLWRSPSTAFGPGSASRSWTCSSSRNYWAIPPSPISPALVRTAVRRATEALTFRTGGSFWNRRRTAHPRHDRLAGLLTPLGLPGWHRTPRASAGAMATLSSEAGRNGPTSP